MDNCEIYGNQGTYGGGIFHSGAGEVNLMHDSSIHDNNASLRDGGGIYSSGAVSLTNVNVSFNVAARHGGGVFAAATTDGLTSDNAATPELRRNSLRVTHVMPRPFILISSPEEDQKHRDRQVGPGTLTPLPWRTLEVFLRSSPKSAIRLRST